MITSTPVELNYPAADNQLLSPRLTAFIRFNQMILYGPARLLFLIFPHHNIIHLQASSLKPHAQYIIASNHQSMLDPFVIGYALPLPILMRLRPIRYFAHNGLFDKILLPLLLSFGAFPARRNTRYNYGLSAAQSFLTDHQTVAIFPEGRRVQRHTRPRSGIEVLVKNTNAQIIPVRLLWRKHRFGFRSYRLTVGEPLKEKNLSARQIMNRIYKLPLAD